jgi:uncharacterized protein
MSITPFYAAVLALLLVVLSVRTLRVRRRLRIPVGDGGNPEMLRAMRVHANFIEYVPISLLLIFMLELGGGWGWLVHALCLALVGGRVVHAYGYGQAAEDFRFRVAGMSLTFTALAGAAIALLVLYV